MSLSQHPLARTLVTVRKWPFFIDAGVALCGLALFFAVLHTAAYWMGTPAPVVPISHSVRALPVYAFYSVVRIAIAYLLSLDIRRRLRLHGGEEPAHRGLDGGRARHPPVHPRAQLSTPGGAGHGNAYSRSSAGH